MPICTYLIYSVCKYLKCRELWLPSTVDRKWRKTIRKLIANRITQKIQKLQVYEAIKCDQILSQNQIRNADLYIAVRHITAQINIPNLVDQIVDYVGLAMQLTHIASWAFGAFSIYYFISNGLS